MLVYVVNHIAVDSGCYKWHCCTIAFEHELWGSYLALSVL